MSISRVEDQSLSLGQIELWRRSIRDTTLANYQYEMGVATDRAGETAAAVAFYERALGILPVYPEAHFRLTALLDRLERRGEAEAARRRAQASDPDFAVKGCCAILAAAIIRGDVDKDDTAFAWARTAAPDHPALRALLDVSALEKGGGMGSDTAEPLPEWARDAVRDAVEATQARVTGTGALMLAERGAAWFPNSPRIWQALGEARFAAHDLAGAIAAYAQCTATAPEDAAYLARHGLLLQQAGDVAGSIALLERALALPGGPQVSGIHIYLSDALFGLLRFDEAEAHLNGILEPLRSKPDLLAQCGVLALARGDAAAAVGRFRAALAAAPRNVWMMTRLSLALLKSGDADGALAMAQAAATQSGLLPGASTFVGLALQGLGRLEEALAVHRKAVEAQPRNGWALTDLGLALQALRRDAEATAAHRSAIAATIGNRLPFQALLRPVWAQQRLDVAYKALGVVSP